MKTKTIVETAALVALVLEMQKRAGIINALKEVNTPQLEGSNISLAAADNGNGFEWTYGAVAKPAKPFYRSEIDDLKLVYDLR